jgi:CelD/BcsL family acetyltransferase involved in cellulose biosynthesis
VNAELHVGDLSRLEPDWEALFRDTAEASPYTAPAWVQGWFAHLGDGATPFAIAVRDAGRLVGLATFALRRSAGARVLRVSGEPFPGAWDILAADEDAAAVADVVARELRARAGAWDLAVLRRFPRGSALPGALRAAGLAVHAGPIEAHPVVDVPATLEAYLNALGRSRRAGVRRGRKRAEAAGVRLHVLTSADEIVPAIERLQSVRDAQWRERDRAMDPSHGSLAARALLTDAARALAPLGRMEIWEYRLGDELLGTWLVLADARTLYGFFGGFRPEASSWHLGVLKIADSVEECVKRGLEAFDLGHGGDAYKYDHGASEHGVPTLVVHTRRPRSLAMLAAARATRRLR